MVTTSANAQELQAIYAQRFAATRAYRARVWRVLIDHYFQRYISETATVLDIGCGYGEFINQVRAAKKIGMDLNPASATHLDRGIRILEQDCSAVWVLPDACLDVVFTSNFFEHLPDKATLTRTLLQGYRCLKPGGKLIAMGPNIRYLPGQYWDFWDHYLPLSDLSLAEGLTTNGFVVRERHARFLPYTMVNARQYPTSILRVYLALPFLWKLAGKQFLIVAERPSLT